MFRSVLGKESDSVKKSNSEAKINEISHHHVLLISPEKNLKIKKQICSLLNGSDYRNLIGVSYYSIHLGDTKFSLWDHAHQDKHAQIMLNKTAKNISSVLICAESCDDVTAFMKKLPKESVKQSYWIVTDDHQVKLFAEKRYNMNVLEVPSKDDLEKFLRQIIRPNNGLNGPKKHS